MLDKNDKGDRKDKNRATPTDGSDFLYVCNYYAMAVNAFFRKNKNILTN